MNDDEIANQNNILVIMWFILSSDLGTFYFCKYSWNIFFIKNNNDEHRI